MLFFLFFFVFNSLAANQYLCKHLRNIDSANYHSNLEGIDCIYVINLTKRPEKWENTKLKLNEQALSAVRVSAINGWQLKKFQVRRLTGGLNKYDTEFNPGRLGCSLSHISAWNHALENNFSQILVLEDDIKFVDSSSRISELINELNALDPEWDVLYTDPNTVDWDGNYVTIPYINCSHPSVMIDDPDYYLFREQVSENFERIRARWGTYSMIISRRGLIKLFRYHLLTDLWTSIDVSIHHTPKIRQYVMKSPIITHDTESRISDTDHEPAI